MSKSLTKKQQSIITQLLVMHEMFPGNETELIYHTPFQLLIAVMMSAQTTDKQVNVVTQVLRNFVQTPQDVVAL
jgi:endonuclease-3